MVAKLTYGVRKFEGVQASMAQAIVPLHRLTAELIPMVDADTSAFNEYMEGVRMPRQTPEEEAVRQAKMQAGLKSAIQVPLTTMRLGDSAWEHLVRVARDGNPASRSDTLVGAAALVTGIWGAYQNVLINLEGIDDQEYRREVLTSAEEIVRRGRKSFQQVLALFSAIDNDPLAP
jgi:glutamate formiminotransferase/formiminotetrahydrofolate cyclodeaminase